MPTIRDFTSALSRRPGVEAVLVSGKDGLLISGTEHGSLDENDIAARIPALVAEASGLGRSGGIGDCTTSILECEHGYAIISAIGGDALLTVLVSKSADLGSLLFDIRSQRSRLGELV